jgi:hypothetical protein
VAGIINGDKRREPARLLSKSIIVALVNNQVAAEVNFIFYFLKNNYYKK